MTHAITGIKLLEPTGINWTCECGVTGTCPQNVAASRLTQILADHLAKPPRASVDPLSRGIQFGDGNTQFNRF